MPPAVLLEVMSLMCQRVLTSKGSSSCHWHAIYERKYMQYAVCFIYFVPLSWRWSFEVETLFDIKDRTHRSRVDV